MSLITPQELITESLRFLTPEALNGHMLQTLRHSTLFEYIALIYDPKLKDVDKNQRPHDLSGENDKFVAHVLFGLAMHYVGSAGYDHLINAAREYHRMGQNHHKMWNNGGGYPGMMMMGAIDTILALREERSYQGRVSWEEIETKAAMEKYPVRQYMEKVSIFVRAQGSFLDDFRIDSVHSIPNIGIPATIHRQIVDRTQETLRLLEGYGFSL